MSSSSRRDPALLRLVAELYYERNLGLQEIAELTGYSVATVSRLRKQALESGVVRITVIKDDLDLNSLASQVSAQLEAEIIVVPSHQSDAWAQSRLTGVAAAPHIHRMLPKEGVVGWLGGHTLYALVSSLPPMELPLVESVPMIGNWDNHQAHLDANGLVRRFASRTKGTAHLLHCPAYFPDRQARDAMASHPIITQVVEKWDQVEHCFTGCGMPPDQESNYFTITDRASQTLRQELITTGVVGDVLGHLFTVDGTLVPSPWAEHMICPSLAQVRGIGKLVSVLGGHAKVRSLVGLARTGLTSTIITDQHAALGALEYLRTR